MKFRYLFLLVLIISLTSTAYARWIKDKVSFQTESVGQVTFSHYNHLEAVGSDCPTCHNDIFHILPKNNPTYSMADMARGKSCGACHNGNTAFSTEENCTECHAGDITWKNEDAGDTMFPHQAHLDMDFTCDTCHPDLFKPRHLGNKMTMDDMSQGEYCGACHDGDTAFSVEEDCESCHQM